MAKEKKHQNAEEFVRRVLTETFKQKPDAETVHAVAEKLRRVIAEIAPKKDTDASKRAA